MSKIDAGFDFEKYGVAPGLGRGPAHPVGFGQPGSVLRFPLPPDPRSTFAGSAWSGQRIPGSWTGAYPPSYRLAGQRYRPSFTRLRAPGCYAYQVDGTSFSYAVVFRAEPEG